MSKFLTRIFVQTCEAPGERKRSVIDQSALITLSLSDAPGSPGMIYTWSAAVEGWGVGGLGGGVSTDVFAKP